MSLAQNDPRWLGTPSTDARSTERPISSASGNGKAGPYGEAASAAVAELKLIEREVAMLQGRVAHLQTRARSLQALVAVLDDLSGPLAAHDSDAPLYFAPHEELSLTPLPPRLSQTGRRAHSARVEEMPARV